MKRILFTLGIVAMMGFSALAQDASTPVADNPNAPVIVFEKTTHDYGTVVQGGDGNCEFKFRNTGLEPLILANVTSSCGCTVPEWPREPIMKGKSASIRVRYDTNRIGQINKYITVLSNAKVGSVQLHIMGNVIEAPAGAQMPQNMLSPGAAPVAK